jgi:hypothetical protein
MKRLLEKSGIRYQSAPEALVYIAMQTAGVVCVVLAFGLPSPIGAAVAVSGCSAVLGMALPRRDWRGRFTQIGASFTALVVAAILIVERPDTKATPPAEASAKPTEANLEPALDPSPQAAVRNRPTVQAPEDPASPDTELPEPLSARNESEHSEPATTIGGVELPDLGDGNPFTSVNMNRSEMDAFEQLFGDYMSKQSKLKEQYQNGEISYDEFSQLQQEYADTNTAELEAIMGPTRVKILTEELARYYQKLALNLDKIDDETAEAMKQSPLWAPIFGN